MDSPDKQSTDATEPILPTLNNRYRLIEKIGSGGMAAVYKGEDLVLGRHVAVKVLHTVLFFFECFLA